MKRSNLLSLAFILPFALHATAPPSPALLRSATLSAAADHH